MKPELVDNLRTVLLDVKEALKIKIDKAGEFWGGIDVLVSNAGQDFTSPNVMRNRLYESEKIKV